jgi:4-amino-4-deoxy-L-arabinose transferase-like glycosyltransferase
MRTDESRIDPGLALHILIGFYTAAHLLLSAWLPLAAHEAHYALYGRDIELSYLDHPPLIAWLQGLVQFFSTTDFAIRLLPIGLSVIAQYLLARLAREIYPASSAWLGFFCVVVLQGTVVFHGSMTLTPDSAVMPLGLLVVLATIRCLEDDAWPTWLGLGLLIGLAGLAKYTAVTLAFSLVVVLVLARGWQVLVSPRLWMAGLVAFVVITPVLLWNWQNGWLTVAFHSLHQFEDVEGWSAVGFLRSSAEQVLYYSPLIVIGGIAALWESLKGRDSTTRAWILPIFVLPVLVVYLLAALESRASPHWSMLGWLLLVPLLVHWLQAHWQASRNVRLLVWVSVGYSIFTLIAIVVLVVPIAAWPDYRHPARLLVGWEEAARHGDELRRGLVPDERLDEPVLLARNWHHAGLLGWYASETPVLNLFRDLNPHNVHRGTADHRTRGVLVYPRDTMDPNWSNLTRDFHCEPIDFQPAYFGGNLLQVFHFYDCKSKLPPDSNAMDLPD